MRGNISLRSVFVLAALSAGIVTAGSAAWAAVPVTVVNAGFEDPVYGEDNWGSFIPGWDYYNGGDIGVWNITPSYYPADAPEGSNVAWVYNEGADTGATQILSGATGRFELDANYSMSFYVGYANGYANAGYQVQLLAGGTVLAQDDNSVTLTQGVFSPSSFSYTYNAAHSALVGEPLEIRLLSKGLAGGEENEFDNVVMNATYAHPIAYSEAYTVLVGTGSLDLDGSGSLPSDGSSISQYEWDLDDDGLWDVTGATPGAISYADLTGTYGMALGDNTVKLRVRDATTTEQVIASTNVLLQMPTTTHTATGNGRSDTWNLTESWDSGVPTGTIDAVVAADKRATVWSTSTPTYTGNLTLEAGSTLQIAWLTQWPQSYNALGTPGSTTIYMHEGSLINIRNGGSPTIPAIQLEGNATISMGQSTQGSAKPTFAYGINGDYTLTLQGKGGCNAYLTTANDFGELVADPLWGSNFYIYANAAGSLGGDVTIEAAPQDNAFCAVLVIGAADAMADTATLTLIGSGGTRKMTMNFDDTIARLIVDGVQQGAGTYGTTGNTGVDYEVDWLAGSGILTVAGVPSAYWDLNGTDPDSGGTAPAGTWDAANTYWNTDSTGGAGGTIDAWTGGDTAVFAAGTDATGTYTVTVSGTQQIVGLRFAQGSVTLSGGALQMTADSLVRVASGSTAMIDTPISDDGPARQLSKGSDGTLVLSGANTYTGVTKLEGGALSVSSLANAGSPSNIGAYPTGGADGLVLAGGTLQYTGGSATVDRGVTLSGNSTIDVSTPGAALTLGASTCSDFASTLTVTGASGSSLSLGAVKVIKSVGLTLNPTTASLTVASVKSESLYGYPAATLALDGTASGNVITGNITIGTTQWEPGMNLAKSGTGDWTIFGNVNAAGTMTVNDGKLMLAGASGYSGNTTVNGGTLEVTGSISNSNVTVNAGGTITGGGTTKNLTIKASGGFTWGYEDGGDHTMDTGNLVLNDLWVLKLVDLGDDPQGTEQYDLFNFTGNYNGSLVTSAITLVEGTNYTVDANSAPDWDIADIDIIVDTVDPTGFRVYVTGIAGSLPGDADENGVVNAADYITLKRNMGQATGAVLADGDFDGDGDVDWYDLQILQGNYGKTSAGASGTIPEPGSAILLMFGAAARLGGFRRRRRS